MPLKHSHVRQRQIRSSGFMIVEILVVIAIVSALLALLLPSLTQAREQARKILCANNQKQLLLATLSYTINHKDKVPCGAYSTMLDGHVQWRTYIWNVTTDKWRVHYFIYR